MKLIRVEIETEQMSSNENIERIIQFEIEMWIKLHEAHNEPTNDWRMRLEILIFLISSKRAEWKKEMKIDRNESTQVVRYNVCLLLPTELWRSYDVWLVMRWHQQHNLP